MSVRAWGTSFVSVWRGVGRRRSIERAWFVTGVLGGRWAVSPGVT